jgi:hypothetical protein
MPVRRPEYDAFERFERTGRRRALSSYHTHSWRTIITVLKSDLIEKSHLPFLVIGSTYLWPCIDMPYIDMPHIDMQRFRFHLCCVISIYHLLGSTCRCQISIRHVFHCHITHTTIRDGTITPRIPLPSFIHTELAIPFVRIQVFSRDLPDHTR